MSLRAHSTGTLLVPGSPGAVLVHRISGQQSQTLPVSRDATYANVGVLDSRGTGTTTSRCCIWVAWVQLAMGGGAFVLFNDVTAAQVTICILSFHLTVQSNVCIFTSSLYLHIRHAR